MMLASSKIMYFITQGKKHLEMIYFNNFLLLKYTFQIHLGAGIFLNNFTKP
jgi:hypothetical protein